MNAYSPPPNAVKTPVINTKIVSGTVFGTSANAAFCKHCDVKQYNGFGQHFSNNSEHTNINLLTKPMTGTSMAVLRPQLSPIAPTIGQAKNEHRLVIRAHMAKNSAACCCSFFSWSLPSVVLSEVLKHSGLYDGPSKSLPNLLLEPGED